MKSHVKLVLAGALLLAGCGGGSGPTRPTPGPTVSVSDAFASEPDGSQQSGVAVFLITLSRALDRPVTFDWATRQETAKSGADFVAGSGTDTIPADSTHVVCTITILADSRIEGAETFDLVLSKITNATFADSIGTATIAPNGASSGTASPEPASR